MKKSSKKDWPLPRIATATEWLKARKKLLESEKIATKHHDMVSAQRRRLPMVEIKKSYAFDGAAGRVPFHALFAGHRQLIVYHFMFDPKWDEGCPACTGYVDAIGDLSLLHARDANFVLISRAPFEKLQAYQSKRGWSFPWFSSFGSHFNYDFHVSFNPRIAPVEYNFHTLAELKAAKSPNNFQGEEHGLSVFLRNGKKIYHTYSAYARGTENLTDASMLLDVTPYGRQEDWEDSPPGWPQHPTYG